jgi:alpha-galactosidase
MMLFQLPGSLPLIGCLCCLPLVVSYDNGAPGSRLPVMGWSSWVALGPAASHPIFDYCDEASVKHAADALVSLGLRDAGYRGFHLDDCWADVKRNGTGYLQAELDHFPNTLQPVISYVHSKGLDFGLYTCAGSHTCVGGRPGSKNHSTKDAAVFAEWQVDWVKQDNCNTNGMGHPADYYKLMSNAMNKTGRPMNFAMCEWGKDAPWVWGNKIAQSGRMSGDHTGVWSSTKSIIAHSASIPAANTGVEYYWNDMDMLETGNYGQAAHANGRESNMSAAEYKTEFSMWAISASPLVVTTPIMNCSASEPLAEPPSNTLRSASSPSSICNIKLRKQFSTEKCIKGLTFGCFDSSNGTMWTKNGCQGNFIVDGASVLCNTINETKGTQYCNPVNCVPWISDLQKEILLNTDVIAVNQDTTPQGRPIVDNDLSVWGRTLSNGDVAIALYNQEDQKKNIGFDLRQVGYSKEDVVCARDLWKHVDVSSLIKNGVFVNQTVDQHSTMMIRLSKC